MGFLDRLLGREPLQQQPQYERQQPPPTGQPYSVPAPSGGASTEDERAIARYKYLLRTAPPEDIERVHAEAFEKLSPEQRQMVLQRLTEDLPAGERPASAEPTDLARSATRAELQRPGYLQGSFGRGGMGMGGMFAGSMLGTIAGFVVGSAIADAMLGDYGSSPEAAEAGDTSGGTGGDASGDTGDTAGDAGGDTGGDAGGDFGGGDAGGGFGDFGGGDFGGDFGGF
jgi:hypothetical protein